MKGRDSRKQTIITAAAAIVGAAVTGAIIGITAVTPFVYAKGSEAVDKAKQKHSDGMPAAKAKKAELDELKKEKKQLDKDKKALETKKKNARKAQAKKIYEERVANGYEASMPLLKSEADKAYADAGKYEFDESKASKPKKEKKSKKSAPIVMEKQEKIKLGAPVDNVPTDDGSEPDYSESASMFKGISF